MEDQTAQRYAELADAFEMHGNPPAGEAFRLLADEARERADRLVPLAKAPPPPGFQDRTMEEEIEEQSALHYLMEPYHVVSLAIDGRKRVLARFQRMADTAHGDTRTTAAYAVEFLKDYISRLEERRRGLPEPLPGWDDDPDPPNWDSDQ